MTHGLRTKRVLAAWSGTLGNEASYFLVADKHQKTTNYKVNIVLSHHFCVYLPLLATGTWGANWVKLLDQQQQQQQELQRETSERHRGSQNNSQLLNFAYHNWIQLVLCLERSMFGTLAQRVPHVIYICVKLGFMICPKNIKKHTN